MTWTISVGLYAKSEALAGVAESAYRRLMAGGDFRDATLYQGYYDLDASLTFPLFSAEQMQVSSREVLTPGTNKALKISLLYTLRSGDRLSLEFWLYGDGFYDGRQVAVSGPLVMKCEYSDFHPKMETLESRNAIEYFLAACGLTPDYTHLPESRFYDCPLHSIIYSDVGRPSLVLSSAVYHQNPAEFGRDFVRMCLEYRDGVTLPRTLSAEGDLWGLQQLRLDSEEGKRNWGDWKLDVPGKDSPDLYGYSSPYFQGSKHILDFLEGLDKDRVEKLAALSSDEIRLALLDGQERHRLANIDVHDFGDHGIAVTTQLMSSILPVYRHISEYYH